MSILRAGSAKSTKKALLLGSLAALPISVPLAVVLTNSITDTIALWMSAQVVFTAAGYMWLKE